MAKRPICCNQSMQKNGHTKSGRQKFKCGTCGSGTQHRNGRKHLLVIHQIWIQELYRIGAYSIRGLSIRFGYSVNTILRYTKRPPKVIVNPMPGIFDCQFCGEKINGKRESFRKAPRSKQAFCDSNCYGAWLTWRRNLDQCKLCQRNREDIAGIRGFVHGLCHQCVNSIETSFGSKEVAELDITNKILKEEVFNARGVFKQ